MFRFAGCIGRKQFFRASAIRIGLYIAAVAASYLPFAILSRTSTCHSATPCGINVFAVVSLLKLVIGFLFIFSFVGISVRRARDAGAPAWLGLIVPILLVADYPLFAQLELTAVVLLTGGGGTQVTSAYAVAALPLILIAGLFVVPSRSDWARPDTLLHRAGSRFLSWMGWHGHQARASTPSDPMPGRTASTKPLIKWPAAIAFALTVTAFVLTLHGKLGLYLILTVFMGQLITVILPSFLLYFALLLAAFLVLRLRSAGSVVLLTLTLLPFAHWGYRHWEPSITCERETREIAAIPTVRADRLPATVVVEASSAVGMQEVWAVPAIQQAIYKSADGRRLLQFERPTGSGPRPLPRDIASLPDDYLLLRAGEVSEFAKVRHFPRGGGPLELRLIGPQRNDLIGVWYSSVRPPPSMLPLLTVVGWHPSRPSDSLEPNVRRLLAKTLLEPR